MKKNQDKEGVNPSQRSLFCDPIYLWLIDAFINTYSRFDGIQAGLEMNMILLNQHLPTNNPEVEKAKGHLGLFIKTIGFEARRTTGEIIYCLWLISKRNRGPEGDMLLIDERIPFTELSQEIASYLTWRYGHRVKISFKPHEKTEVENLTVKYTRFLMDRFLCCFLGDFIWWGVIKPIWEKKKGSEIEIEICHENETSISVPIVDEKGEIVFYFNTPGIDKEDKIISAEFQERGKRLVISWQ